MSQILSTLALVGTLYAGIGGVDYAFSRWATPEARGRAQQPADLEGVGDPDDPAGAVEAD